MAGLAGQREATGTPPAAIAPGNGRGHRGIVEFTDLTVSFWRRGGGCARCERYFTPLLNT